MLQDKSLRQLQSFEEKEETGDSGGETCCFF